MTKLKSQLISNGLHGDYVHRDKVKEIAELYSHIRELEASKLQNIAKVLKICLQHLTPDEWLYWDDARKRAAQRRELIARLPEIIKLLEGETK